MKKHQFFVFGGSSLQKTPKLKTLLFHWTYAKFTSQKKENDHFQVGLQTPPGPPRDPARPPWDLPRALGPPQPPPGDRQGPQTMTGYM